MKFINTIRKIFILIITLLIVPSAFAETSGAVSAPSQEGWLFWLAIGIVIFLFLVIIFILYALLTFLHYNNKSSGQAVPQITIWEGIKKKLTNEVPAENEEAILMHHEYDGIRELDNSLPPWWVYMFYATFIFGVIYIGYYHFSDEDKLQDAEYVAEIKKAEIDIAEFMKTQANSIDENNVKLLTDKEKLVSAQELFNQNCAACHGKQGEGSVGPNLTDEYWLHGGGVKNVFKTIKYGVPDKGMISWKAELTPAQIQGLASYIISLKGTNPPNGKAPQGEVYKEK